MHGPTASAIGGRASAWVVVLATLVACGSNPTQVPYPAFVQASELADIFVAGLPGIRAKRFAGDLETRRSSSLLTLPPDWSFTTGGMPNKSVEIYVLAGTVNVGEFALTPGGYAYLPDGSSGVPLQTTGGARILYFLDDANPAAVIQTPLISSEQIIGWQPLSADLSDAGLSVKELRKDPGSGARTYLLRIEPGATRPWQSLSVVEEGYLLRGSYTHSECVAGEAVTADYLPGGYYHRPENSVNGGPESGAAVSAVWLVRTLSPGMTTTHAGCLPAESPALNPAF